MEKPVPITLVCKHGQGRQQNEGDMKFEISRRGKAYLKTAETLLRSAKTMTDAAVATQLEALAASYQRQAAKVSRDDAARAARATGRTTADADLTDTWSGVGMLAIESHP